MFMEDIEQVFVLVVKETEKMRVSVREKKEGREAEMWTQREQ